MTKSNKTMLLGLLLAVALLIIVDRAMWASVAQWREDQATNLWLGLIQNPTRIPVGLISSYNLPNPNGMVVLGSILRLLPSMWAVSIFLSCLQAALIVGIGWVSFPNNKRLLLLASAPLLTSIVMRGTSIEFWSQSLMTTVNLLFLLWAVLYMRRPSLGKIPIVVGLVLFSPALYLAGLVNSVAMAGIGAALVLRMPPKGWRKNWWKAAVPSLVVSAVCIGLIWIPYFQAVTVDEILTATAGNTLGARVVEMASAILRSPDWGTFLSSDQGSFAIWQSSRSILSRPAARLVDFSLILQLIQGVLSFAVLGLVLGRYLSRPESRSEPIASNARRLVLLSVCYLLAAYALSPLLGGVSWATGERRDQVVQFLPFLFLLWFLTPFAFRLPRLAAMPIRAGTTLLAVVYVVVSTVGGLLVVQSHLSYRGNELSDADVPLVQKMEAVDFMAQDFESCSSGNIIPVDYRLGGGRWDWITAFGHQLEPWYDAPYTIGRGFDYDLLRRYGLSNAQEGVQQRSFGTGRYLVTYAFEPQPDPDIYPMHHYYFGRLRVTVVDLPTDRCAGSAVAAGKAALSQRALAQPGRSG